MFDTENCLWSGKHITCWLQWHAYYVNLTKSFFQIYLTNILLQAFEYSLDIEINSSFSNTFIKSLYTFEYIDFYD